MFNSLLRLPKFALLALLTAALPIQQSHAQSVELAWQQTASTKNQALTAFDQYSLQGDFQAVLLGIERRNYDTHQFDDQPIAGLNHLKLGVQYYHQFNERYAMWPRLQVMTGYDHHVTSDSLTYNPQFAAIRTLTDDMSIVIGVGALMHTAENQYYPVAGLVWQPSGSTPWSGNLTIPQADIAYHINERWFAEAGLKWQTRYYKTVRSFSDAGFMRTQDTLVSFGARRDLDTNLRLSARVTYAFARKLRLYAANTANQLSENPPSGFGFRLAVSYHF